MSPTLVGCGVGAGFGRGRGAIWTPSDLTGLVTLYDASADYIVKDGSNKVSQWLDATGTHDTSVQNTGSAQPTWTANWRNGQPAVLFDGNDVLNIASGLIGGTPGVQEIIPFSMFMVVQPTATTGSQVWLNLGNGSQGVGLCFGLDSVKKHEVLINAVAVEHTTIDATTNPEWWLFNNSAIPAPDNVLQAHYVDGVATPLDVGNNTPITGGEAHIGGRTSGGPSAKGYIALIGVCLGAMSVEEIALLDAYISSRFDM